MLNRKNKKTVEEAINAPKEAVQGWLKHNGIHVVDPTRQVIVSEVVSSFETTHSIAVPVTQKKHSRRKLEKGTENSSKNKRSWYESIQQSFTRNGKG